MNSPSPLHIVFGTGPAGTTLAHHLLSQGKRVRCVNRTGQADIPGTEIVSCDLLDADAVDRICAGATVIYHCANVPYPDQVRILPLFQANLIRAASRAGARLVVLDTLYVYGETRGLPMTEAMPNAATTRKGRMRAQLAKAYLGAHEAGVVQVTLGRAADFFGPGVLNSALGDRVFPAALAGKPVQLLGDLDLPHSYSYIGDVARGLAILGESDEAVGRAWLLPVAPPLTQRAVSRLIASQLGKPVRAIALPKMAIRAFGLFSPFMREFVEMFYQYTEPQIVDSRLFEKTFGLEATPFEMALHETLDWYALRSRSPETPRVVTGEAG